MKKKKKILCYLRPFTKKQYGLFVKFIAPKDDIIHCSEHASVDKTGLPKLYYSFLKRKKLEIKNTKLTLNDINDIIARCRLLRNLKKTIAIKHLLAMYFAIDKILSDQNPDFVTMQTVDAFIPDLFRFICKKKNIKFVGVVATFVHNHFRITSRGERTINKKFDKKLVKSFLPSLLKDTYFPKYGKVIHDHKISIYKNWLTEIIGVFYFYLKRYLSGDRYNFHYWHRQIYCQKNFRFFPPRVVSHKDWEDKIKISIKPTLYIPLAKDPEATIDYWCEDLKMIKYYETLEKVIKKFHKDFSIFIKEHPAVVGSRPKNFYLKLKNDKRITSIPSYTNSNFIINKVDCILVWTGTVGFDAMIRGKPVLGLAKSFMVSGKRFLKIDFGTKMKKIKKHIIFCKSNLITKSEQEKTFRNVAKQLYKGNYNYHMAWSDKNPKDLDDIKQMANSCKHLFKL